MSQLTVEATVVGRGERPRPESGGCVSSPRCFQRQAQGEINACCDVLQHKNTQAGVLLSPGLLSCHISYFDGNRNADYTSSSWAVMAERAEGEEELEEKTLVSTWKTQTKPQRTPKRDRNWVWLSRGDSDVGMPHWLHLTPSVTERVAMPHAHVGEGGLTFSALFRGQLLQAPKAPATSLPSTFTHPSKCVSTDRTGA